MESSLFSLSNPSAAHSPIMSKADDVFDRIVDVHSVKIPKQDLEDMFKKCGSVTNLFHWKGGHDKPHMLVEYASLSSAKTARAMSNDKSGLQVIRAYNNDGLIRKFNELCRSHSQNKDRTSFHPPKGPRNRTRSRSRSPASQRRVNSSFRRPFSPLRRQESNIWKTGRRSPELRRDESTSSGKAGLASAPTGIAPTPVSQSSSEKKDRSCLNLKDLSLLTATPMSDNDSSKQLNDSITSSSPTVLRIPYAGEVIHMDLKYQLEENPIGIITILTATEAAQQLWMVVAAHYNGRNNQTSARRVLEAGIDLSARLGRTDTRPFWYLLDRIAGKKPKASETGSSDPSPQSAQNVLPTNSETKINTEVKVPSNTVQVSSRTPDTVRGNPTSNNKGIPRETESLINKLEAENRSLRTRYHSLIDDLSEARAGKRRAEDEIKEERSVRRKLERDLKETEDALKRSKRMEQTALDQFKTEVEFRRKAEVVLANMKAQQPRLDSQQKTLFQLVSLIKTISPQASGRCSESRNDPRLALAQAANTTPPCSAQ